VSGDGCGCLYSMMLSSAALFGVYADSSATEMRVRTFCCRHHGPQLHHTHYVLYPPLNSMKGHGAWMVSGMGRKWGPARILWRGRKKGGMGWGVWSDDENEWIPANLCGFVGGSQRAQGLGGVLPVVLPASEQMPMTFWIAHKAF
jgi:hypothetical protein